MGTKRDAEAFEERRARALDLFGDGMKQAEIARKLGVTRQSVSTWIAAARRGGAAALKAKPRPGRPPKLDAARRRRLLKALERGPTRFGYATQLWTAKRIQKLIRERFGIRFHVNHVPKLLRDCGWSYQRPTARANERDEAAVAGWLTKDWPRIKKKRVASAPR